MNIEEGTKRSIMICERCSSFYKNGNSCACTAFAEELLFNGVYSKSSYQNLGVPEHCPYDVEHMVARHNAKKEQK